MVRLIQCGQHPASFLPVQISFFRILLLGFKGDREQSEADDEGIFGRLGLSWLNSCCKHILWTWANNLFPCAPKSLNICLYLSILSTLVKCIIKIRMPRSPTAHCYLCRGGVELVILSVLCLASTAERMEKVTALTIPWGWHNKCMSTVIVS